MAKLILADGTEVKVDYNQAAKVYQILTGEKEPENKKQADFAANVKEVVFDNKGKVDKPWESMSNSSSPSL